MPHHPQSSVDSTASLSAFEDDGLLSENPKVGTLEGEPPATCPAAFWTESGFQNGTSPNSSRQLTIMLVFFGLGTLFAVSHHVFYLRLSGQEAGSDDRQQWSIRIATVLAVMTIACFASVITTASTQCLWKTLASCAVPLESIDSAFQMDRDIMSLFSIGAMTQFKLVTLLTIASWLLRIISAITPATLTVTLAASSFQQQLHVLVPDIDATLNSSRFAFIAPVEDGSIEFLGPTTILERIAAATSSQGQILSSEVLNPNTTYNISFFAPAVSCELANGTIKELMFTTYNDTVIDHKAPPVSLQYWAFSPSANAPLYEAEALRLTGLAATQDIELGGISRFAYGDTASGSTLTGSNQIWILFSQPSASPRYSYTVTNQNNDTGIDTLFNGLVCKMHNASYTATVMFTNGVQAINVIDLVYNKYLYFPQKIGIPNITDPYSSADDPNSLLNVTGIETLDIFPWFDQSLISYSAFMYTIRDLLHGVLSVHNSTEATINSELDSSIIETSLAGSVDLRGFFEFSYMDYQDYPGRIPDSNLARNRTLSELIEELSVNITLSLMSEELLCRRVPVTANVDTLVTVYQYSSRNLLLAYGLAFAVALLAIIIGFSALRANGVGYDKSFSTILRVTRNPSLDNMCRSDEVDSAPFSGKSKESKIRFGILRRAADGTATLGFGLDSQVEHLRPRKHSQNGDLSALTLKGT